MLGVLPRHLIVSEKFLDELGEGRLGPLASLGEGIAAGGQRLASGFGFVAGQSKPGVRIAAQANGCAPPGALEHEKPTLGAGRGDFEIKPAAIGVTTGTSVSDLSVAELVEGARHLSPAPFPAPLCR